MCISIRCIFVFSSCWGNRHTCNLYLSAFLLQSLHVCGAFPVLLRHIAGHNYPGYASYSFAFSLSRSVQARVTFLLLPPPCVSVVYRCAGTHRHMFSLRSLTNPPFCQKSINKCIVSSLAAVAISLSKLSKKAARCEIEFRAVWCARGHKMSVSFAYLFILRQ